MVDLDQFIEQARELSEQATQGRKIAEAAEKGYVKPERYERRVDAAYDQRIREMCMEVIFGVWNTEKRDATLKEVYKGVLKKIAKDIEAGEWPKVWLRPSKRTTDRRMGELHEMNQDFWGKFDCPPCVCLKAGTARPNPMLFDESVRTDIARAAER